MEQIGLRPTGLAGPPGDVAASQTSRLTVRQVRRAVICAAGAGSRGTAPVHQQKTRLVTADLGQAQVPTDPAR